jgi:hypothetical protein
MSLQSSRPPRPHGRGGPCLRLLPALLLPLVLGGCTRTERVLSREVVGEGGSRNPPLRSAANLPTTFIVITPAAVSTDCPPVLRDPVLNTVLTLQASTLQPIRDEHGTHYQAIGDYSAEPRGRYGDEEPGDGIRVDCVRLRPLGIVRLGPAGG